MQISFRRDHLSHLCAVVPPVWPRRSNRFVRASLHLHLSKSVPRRLNTSTTATQESLSKLALGLDGLPLPGGPKDFHRAVFIPWRRGTTTVPVVATAGEQSRPSSNTRLESTPLLRMRREKKGTSPSKHQERPKNNFLC